jgi:hypothetical protein
MFYGKIGEKIMINIKPQWQLEKSKSSLIKSHCFFLEYKEFFCRYFYSHGLYFGYIFIGEEKYFNIAVHEDRHIVQETLEIAYACYKIGSN